MTSITVFETLIRNAACLDTQTPQTRSLSGARAELRSLKSSMLMPTVSAVFSPGRAGSAL